MQAELTNTGKSTGSVCSKCSINGVLPVQEPPTSSLQIKSRLSQDRNTSVPKSTSGSGDYFLQRLEVSRNTGEVRTFLGALGAWHEHSRAALLMDSTCYTLLISQGETAEVGGAWGKDAHVPRGAPGLNSWL